MQLNKKSHLIVDGAYLYEFFKKNNKKLKGDDVMDCIIPALQEHFNLPVDPIRKSAFFDIFFFDGSNDKYVGVSLLYCCSLFLDCALRYCLIHWR